MTTAAINGRSWRLYRAHGETRKHHYWSGTETLVDGKGSLCGLTERETGALWSPELGASDPCQACFAAALAATRRTA